MDGAGWENGDFTGDGAVNAQDLNVIGINWQNGEAAPAAGRRVPRAPLAAAQRVTAAVVDVAIDHFVMGGRMAGRDRLASLSDNVSSEYGFEFNRSRYVASSFRRHSMRRDESLAQVEDDEAKLVDDLFAKL